MEVHICNICTGESTHHDSITHFLIDWLFQEDTPFFVIMSAHRKMSKNMNYVACFYGCIVFHRDSIKTLASILVITCAWDNVMGEMCFLSV